MTLAGIVLGWKFGVSGISTRQNDDGSLTVTGWPDGIGARPTAEQIAVWTAEYEAAQSVPVTVTPLQARRALRAAGLISVVNAWVAGQPDDDIRDAWEFASVIERHGPITLGAADALGLSDAQLDGLFIAASKL